MYDHSIVFSIFIECLLFRIPSVCKQNYCSGGGGGRCRLRSGTRMNCLLLLEDPAAKQHCLSGGEKVSFAVMPSGSMVFLCGFESGEVGGVIVCVCLR